MYEKLCPVGSINNVLRLVLLHVPENTDFVAAEKGKLVSSIWVTEPRSQVFFLLEGWDFGWGVLLIDTPFAAVALDIGKLVD